MGNSHDYSYHRAIQRNIGLVNESEQLKLKHSKIAIAGVGAVGGSYLINLARMGIANFKIADPDIFEVPNLQRQAGAFISQLGKKKVESLKMMALDINPEIQMDTFENGITEDNIDQFLSGIDLVIDGIDAFQIAPRRLLYKKAREKGIFVFCSAPIAFGATLQVFDPNKISFDQYYGVSDNMTRAEQIASFLLGLAPKLLSKSQMDEKYIDFIEEKGPALASTISFCAGIVTTEILKFLLNKKAISCAPNSFYFNAYDWSFTKRKRRPIPFKWLQKILIQIAFKKYPSLKELHVREKEQNFSPKQNCLPISLT